MVVEPSSLVLDFGIQVTGNSVLEACDFRASVSTRPKENRINLLRSAERRFKTINSFTQVDAQGGQLVLRLKLSVNGSSTGCDYETIKPSPVVRAIKLEPLLLDGCFHPEQAGIFPK